MEFPAVSDWTQPTRVVEHVETPNVDKPTDENQALRDALQQWVDSDKEHQRKAYQEVAGYVWKDAQSKALYTQFACDDLESLPPISSPNLVLFGNHKAVNLGILKSLAALKLNILELHEFNFTTLSNAQLLDLPNVNCLEFHACKFSTILELSFTHVRELAITFDDTITHLAFKTSPCLEKMTLEHLSRLWNADVSIPTLKTLVIIACDNLRSLSPTSAQGLHDLTLKYLPLLGSLPSAFPNVGTYLLHELPKLQRYPNFPLSATRQFCAGSTSSSEDESEVEEVDLSDSVIPIANQPVSMTQQDGNNDIFERLLAQIKEYPPNREALIEFIETFSDKKRYPQHQHIVIECFIVLGYDAGTTTFKRGESYLRKTIDPYKPEKAKELFQQAVKEATLPVVKQILVKKAQALLHPHGLVY